MRFAGAVQARASQLFLQLAAVLLIPGHVNARPLDYARAVKSPDAAQVLTSVAWSPDGRLLAAAGETPPVYVWEVAGLKLMQRLDGGVRGMAMGRHSIAFSPDGKLLAAGCRAVRLWETATWTLARELIGPGVNPRVPQPVGVQSLQFDPDGRTLVVFYHGSTPFSSAVVSFSLSDRSVQWLYELHPQLGHPRILPPLMALPEHHEIAFASGQLAFGGPAEESTAVIFLNTATGSETRRIERIHSQAPASVAISRDEKLLATASHYGMMSNSWRDTDPLRVWDTASGKTLHELLVKAGVWALTFSPDGRYLIASEIQSPGHNQLTVWRVDSWTEVQTVSLPAAQTVWDLTFSPDGRYLAAVSPYEVSLFQFAPN